MQAQSLRRAVFASLGALALAGAFCAGRWSAPSPPPPLARAPGGPDRTATRAAPEAAAPSAASGQAWAEDVRRVIREELTAIVCEPELRAHPQPAAEAPASPASLASMDESRAAPAERSHEVATLAREALSTLESATARRRWTEADRDRWTSLVSQLPMPDRIELEQQLMMAINKDEIALDPGASPYAPPELAR